LVQFFYACSRSTTGCLSSLAPSQNFCFFDLCAGLVPMDFPFVPAQTPDRACFRFPAATRCHLCFLFHVLLCRWSLLLRFGFPSPCTWCLDVAIQLRDHAKDSRARTTPCSRFIFRFAGSRSGPSAQLVLALILFSFLKLWSPRPRCSASPRAFCLASGASTTDGFGFIRHSSRFCLQIKISIVCGLLQVKIGLVLEPPD
jgi:hypothetical protein